jgi:hypothetical protein
MKSTRLLTSLFGVLAAVAVLSCNSKNPQPKKENLVKVSYVQTYCADPWGNSSTPQQLQTTATAYLAQQNITLVDASASTRFPESMCRACTCTTGVVLEGAVRSADLAAVLALGFTKR